MLPFIVFISKGGDKCLKCIVEKRSEIISDEEQVRPGLAGLVLGWVPTLKQKLLC